MDMRMIMFIIFSVAMGLSFIGKAYTTFSFTFDSHEAMNQVFQSFLIRVIIVCICYFVFF